MKIINWNTEKSLALKESRKVCFEDIVFYIERGEILDDYTHPNQKAYPGQRIMVVGIDNYAYLVPYIEKEEELFLKTIIPSRKATQKYLGESNED
ncbi:MAG: toxin [Syntrophales bacterium LBB04]|nr:toxin [Syntrophales bacterium LBB04]